MNTKVYTFLLGFVLSTAVFVLVSFKNEEKALEKEQMIVIAKGFPNRYELFVSRGNSYEKFKYENAKGDYLNYVSLLAKITEYQKEGWTIVSNNHSSNLASVTSEIHCIYFLLEK